ncbi:hypothetical protein BC940DRAFT_61760 [Gongronella butleri]|nr:hypothetical protein BC940DRAFT_61760 [Gongronella butleri]
MSKSIINCCKSTRAQQLGKALSSAVRKRKSQLTCITKPPFGTPVFLHKFEKITLKQHTHAPCDWSGKQQHRCDSIHALDARHTKKKKKKKKKMEPRACLLSFVFLSSLFLLPAACFVLFFLSIFSPFARLFFAIHCTRAIAFFVPIRFRFFSSSTPFFS